MSSSKTSSTKQNVKNTNLLIKASKQENSPYSFDDFVSLAADCVESAHNSHGLKRGINLMNASRLIRVAKKSASPEEKEKLKAVKLFRKASRQVKHAKSEKDVNSAINNMNRAINISQNLGMTDFADMLDKYKEPFETEASINVEKTKQKSLERKQKSEQRKQKRASKRIARNEKAINKDNFRIEKSQEAQYDISTKLEETKSTINALKGCGTGKNLTSAKPPKSNSRNKNRTR